MTTGAEKTFRTWTLPLSAYPSLSPFARDLVTGEGRAAAFVGNGDPGAIEPPGRTRNRDALADALARTNREWGNRVDEVIGRWSAGRTATLIAGQQVGLGGGPIYTLAKLASLLAMKRNLEAAGTPATVFFWMATEDHDFDEVARLDVATRDAVERIRLSAPPDRRPVGDREIPDRLRRELCRALGIDRAPTWLREGTTFRDSFAELVATAIPGEIVLVDALLPELRAAGRDVLRGLGEALDDVEAIIDRNSREIADAGYPAQVSKSEDGHYSLLYWIDDRGFRQPIRRSGDGWAADGRPIDLPPVLESEPERVSTGALARPLLQDAVFEPDVFVGGPAEVAYYAQLRGVHERLEIAPPGVALRGHALVAPSKVLRALERYGIEPGEAFDTPDEIVLRRERERTVDVGLVATRMEADLAGGLEEMKTIVLASDPSLEKSLDRTARKIHYHLSKLADRGRRALARRDRERHAALDRAHRILMPGGVAQDRTIGWVGYWMTYGPRVVERLVDEIDPDANELKIVGV